jgi:hypothetical protein
MSFGGQPSGFTINDDTSITVTAPVGDAIDLVTVTVTTLGGASAAGAGSGYTYTAVSACGAGCSFLSPAMASATTGASFAFTVATTGGLTPILKEKGKLPTGVTFVDNGDGTGTFYGVPAATGKKPDPSTYRLKVLTTFT